MSNIVETARYGRVLRVALNRPDKRNALNIELCTELVRVLEEAERDDAVGAILLTGNGKSFCAGMDLGEVGSAPTEEINRLHERLFTIGIDLEKPIVGAVNGAALGGGVGLVANCHIVIASDDATFGLTEIRLGLWPFLIYRAVSNAIRDRRTAELALTGRVFGAREAREMGLIHEVSYDWEESAADLARTVASHSPTAIRSGLRFVRETRGRNWESAGEIARRMRNDLFASLDFQEGVQAFKEKRPPKWPSLG